MTTEAVGAMILVEGEGQDSIPSERLQDMIFLRRMPRSAQDNPGVTRMSFRA